MELTNSASESVPDPDVTSLINLNPPGQALPTIAIFGPSITPDAVEAVLIALDDLKKGDFLGLEVRSRIWTENSSVRGTAETALEGL